MSKRACQGISLTRHLSEILAQLNDLVCEPVIDFQVPRSNGMSICPLPAVFGGDIQRVGNPACNIVSVEHV
jgi:hypothetical protein